MDNQTSGNKSLPSIENLFKQAWATFKGTWVQLLILYLVVLGIIIGAIVVLIICFAVFLGGGITSGGLSSNNFLTLFTNPAILLPLGILSVIGFSIMVIASLVGQIGMIKIIGGYPNKKTLGEIFHESFILPVIGASLLSGFLIIGGTIVFIIPGILFELFFLFVLYEVILDNKGILQALRSSFALTSANFWGIVLRLLVLVGIYIIYSIVIFGIAKAVPALSSLTNLIGIPFGWFVSAYMIALYKELKSNTGTKTEKSIAWIIILSIIGWAILIGLSSFVISNAKNFMPKPQPYIGHTTNFPNQPAAPVTHYQNISTSSSVTY